MNRALVGVALVASVLLGGCTSGAGHSSNPTATASTPAASASAAAGSTDPGYLTASPTHVPLMPTVLGMSDGAARAVLVAAGITFGRITSTSPPPRRGIPAGSVTSQYPAPGTPVSSATTVNLIVAG
jgi:hypothetical protein